MQRNKFIIIGVGSIGQELLKKISKEIEIECVDLSHEAAETAKKIRGDCRVTIGDATSRLVLEEAGVADADGVIITTTTEKINVEAARILKEHFDVRRIISIARTKAEMEALEQYGVEAENIFTASATAIRNKLEQTSRAAHAIGLGKNEILEVEVHPHSRLAHRPLRTLTPIKWRIGIIYRDENIVIPGRETVLKPKDKVVILGDPAALKTVSEILTFKFQQFPLEYGSAVITYITGRESRQYFDEIEYLFTVFPLSKIIVILSRDAASKKELFAGYLSNENIKNVHMVESADPPLPAIQEAASDIRNELGVIMISKRSLIDPVSPFPFQGQKRNFLGKLLEISNSPVLLSNETFPYEKALVPCVEGVNPRHSLETAVEIASSLNNEVTASLVRPSKYISSEEDIEEFEAMKKEVNDISLMYKLSIKTSVQDGNPVKIVTAFSKDFHLLIAESNSWKSTGLFSGLLKPDVPWHIIKNSDISVLLLPAAKESL